VVTIHAADYCAYNCQENYPDEFCSKYPPEGIPALPRTVEDWGTKFNITANMMTEGIEKIHAAGGKVNLAYGGSPYSAYGSGISADNYEDFYVASGLAHRIAKNIEDWNLDGVDFFFAGSTEGCMWSENPLASHCSTKGSSVLFHYTVIKLLRRLLPSSKTISYTTNHSVDFVSKEGHDHCHANNNENPCGEANIMEAVIAATHPFLDKFSFKAVKALDDENLDAMEVLGIPLSKLGAVFVNEDLDTPSSFEVMKAKIAKIKERGLAGLSLFSINQENSRYRGEWARFVAGWLSA